MELLKTWLLLAFVVGSQAVSLSSLSSRDCSKQECNSENARYEIGKTYTYTYTAASSTWINGTSEEKSSLGFVCKAQIDVISPCELILQLRDVSVTESDPSGNHVPATNQESLRRELQAHSLRFALNDGVVTNLCPAVEEDTWALNFKRGFLSAIQAPVTEIEEPTVTTETDVTGKCPVKLMPSVNAESIMKFKDFKQCEHRAKLEGGLQVTMLKPDAPLFSLLECSQECEVSFQSHIVSESSCRERHISKAFSRQQAGAVTLVVVSVGNLEITEAAVSPSKSIIERQTTILFDHEETKHETEQEVVSKTKEILGSINQKLSKGIGVEMPNLFSDLVTEMRKVETTVGMTELRQFAEGESEALFGVFKDALPMCETTPSVETMVTIMKEIAASDDDEARRDFNPTRVIWLTLPATISHPTKEMISALMPVIEDLSVEDGVFFLPISALINKYCTTENPSCLEETEVQDALGYFQQLLGYDCTPSETVPSLKMLMALKALTNARRLSTDSKISIINNCFDHQHPTKGMEIQIAALELIRRLPCNPEYQTYAKAMYKNQHFDSELRIAAYRAIMTCPDSNIMAAIKEVMMEEESNQVGSYVWSHLSNLNETSDPQKQHLKKWVQESGLMKAFSNMDLRKFSRNMELSWYSDEMGSGLTLDGDMIFSPKSFLPREMRVNSTVEIYGYAINLFEIGGRMEGMHQYLESFFGPRGLLKENSIQELFKEYQQRQQEAFLNALPEVEEVTLPEGLPEGVTEEMYTQLRRLLQLQQKLFGGKMPLPLPGEPMPAGMPKGMTQEIYDELLEYFMREGVPGDRKKRHLIRDSSINDIESQYHVDVEDHPSASVYLKMFGNEIGYLDIAKIQSRFAEVKSSMNPMKILMDLAQEKTHELSKNAILMDGSWTIPTAIGLPLKLAVNGTVSMKVRTEGKLDMRGILMAPRSFEIDGIVEPSAALEISTSMEVRACQTRSGLNHVARLQSSVALGGKIQVTNGKAFLLELNVPDQKQDIIDISSSIYLRRQEEALEMPGIPERLEQSYRSGPVMTKFFGSQICAELAFPKSYAREGTPMFPLTGPAHMLVTLEKTDPSLSSWKLEGSYELHKETVNKVQMLTDRFHFMVGAPDTDIPRTIQVDFTYNRNDMVMDLNIVSPVKTVDVHSEVINNEMLRKLEVTLTLDKVDIYTLDTEVESRPSVVDGDPVINFFPRMDVTSPRGLELKFRSSISVRDGQQKRVGMWMSLDSPRTSLVTVSGDVVQTESSRKLRYSTDLQISGRYVNVNVSAAWQKQKQDNVITMDATVLRRVRDEIVKEVVINTKYTNRTTQDRDEWDLKTDWAFRRYPILNFLFESEYVGTPGSSESTSKLCYRYNGKECGQDTKVVMSHLLTWESSESVVSENLNFKIRNPANLINLELQQRVIRNSSHPLDFTFTVLNKTSELEVVDAVLRVRNISREPIKGDFEAFLRSQTWTYGVLQDWEFVKMGQAVMNTAVYWEDQRATFGMNFLPTRDEESGLRRYDFNSELNYPLGNVRVGWYAWKKGNDISHGASASLIDQSLFAYQLDFTNHTTDPMQPEVNLDASFNLTRPMSPISVILRASRKGNDITSGLNVTRGNIKTLTSDFCFSHGKGEDKLPKTNLKVFVDVEIPEKDFSVVYSQTSLREVLKSEDEMSVEFKGKQIYYRHTLMTFAYYEETERLDIMFEDTCNMSYSWCDMGWRINSNIIDGNHDHKIVVHKDKVPVVFLKVNYDKNALKPDEKDQNSLLVGTDRHEVKVILRTPLAIIKDVTWNTTLDLAPAIFNFDTRLSYFPDQERPLVLVINYQNKSSELVTHNELTTTFETVKRRIIIFNMAKFDLSSGVILGSSTVEMGVNGTKPEKFEVNVEYTNKTEDETTTHELMMILNSPDNTIKTDGSLTYMKGSTYTSTFSILVSEESVFEVQVTVRNDSDSTQESFDVDSSFGFFEHEYRVHTVHHQDANSFNPNVKVYRATEENPIAEADVAYTKVQQQGEIHTVVVTLKPEDIDPLTISTVYTNESNNQNVDVVLSTSKDKQLHFVFNLESGSSETEAATYDVRFTIDNTYIPTRNMEVTAHFGTSDDKHNLNSDLTISGEHLMTIVYTFEDASPSDTHVKKAVDFKITFPQMSDYPALANLGMQFDREYQPESKMGKVAFLWGQLTDDEMVSVKVTAGSDLLEMLIVHPMELPLLPKEITLVLRNNTDPASRHSFEVEMKEEDISLMMLSGSYALIDDSSNNHRAMLAFSRPDHPEIRMTVDMAVLREDTVFSSHLLIKYSEEEDRLVDAMVELINQTSSDSMGFDVNMAVRHPVSGVDLSTALTVLNNNEKMSVGMEGEILVDGETEPLNFEFTWNKVRKEYTIMSQVPCNKMEFYSQFEDRSYGDYKIYRVTMRHIDNGDSVMRSVFDYNSQLKEISLRAFYNPEREADYMRLRVGFLNDTALAAVIDSERNEEYFIDARLLVALQSPKVLLNHLEWDPKWIEFVEREAVSIYDRVIKDTIARCEPLRDSLSLSNRIRASYNDFLLGNEDIKNTLESMKERLLNKWEVKKAELEEMLEDFEMKSQDYWDQVKEYLEPQRVDLEAWFETVKEKYALFFMELNETATNYIKTTSQRVKAFYNQHVKPLFEELEELFDTLAQQNKTQMDILIPQIRPLQDYWIPKPEPEPKEAPKYMVGGKEDIGEPYGKPEESVILTGISVPDEEPVSYTPENPFTARFQSFKQLKIWADIEKLLNDTKVELEAIFAEIDEEFKGSNFYFDLMERWEDLKEQIPVQQWYEKAENKTLEIWESEEVLELRATLDLMKEELAVSTNVTKAGLIRIRDRILESLQGYSVDLLDYLKNPGYELVRYDLEAGDILLLVHLPFEVHSLQQMPAFLQQWNTLQRLQAIMAEVRERSKNTLGEIPMADGTTRSLYDLMFSEPMLLYREGNFTRWIQGERIKFIREFWKAVYLSKLYLNPVSWFPPHEANAMIVGANHYMTFDRTFYDFSGGCSYLLAHDFIDGNFTVVVDYNRDRTSGDRKKSIVLYLNSTVTFEIDSDFQVHIGKQHQELPVEYGRTTIIRYFNSIRIHNTNGVTITCNLAYDICNVNVSGWYFGKTAGLFGTYNYEPNDDFMTSDGDMARHIDDFTRSWKVGRRCSGSSTDTLPACNSDPEVEANSLCYAHFLNEMSSLTHCLGVVDPEPFYDMCASKMCQLTEEEREKEACRAIKAYVDECNKLSVGIVIPNMCVVCDSPDGEFTQGETKVLAQPEIVINSADIVLVVENKPCNDGSDMLDSIYDIADRLDTELKSTRGFTDNRFGLYAFGGDGVQDLPHIRTIDGQIFNTKIPLRSQGLPALEFDDDEDGSNDTFAAILGATNYPFRAGVAKIIVLFSCSKCQRLYHPDKTYSSVASILIRQGIQFNVLMEAHLELVPTRAKNTSPKNINIYGIDDKSVFTNKALSSGSLTGDKSIRKLVNEPINQCALLAYESGGALFDLSKIEEKKFVDVLTQRMVQHTVVWPCQACTCQAGDEGVGRAVCEPCGIADQSPWLYEMERSLAEANYYGQLGMQALVDYIATPAEDNRDTAANKTPGKSP